MKPRIGLCIASFLLAGSTLALAREPGKGRRPPPDQAGQRQPGDQRRTPDGRLDAPRPVREFADAVRALDLTQEQRTEIREILSDVPQQVRELNEETQNMERRDRAQRFMELVQSLRQEVESKLTPEQRGQLEENLAAARERRDDNRQNRDGRPGEPPPPNAGNAPPPGEPRGDGRPGEPGQPREPRANAQPGQPRDGLPPGQPRDGRPGEPRQAPVDRLTSALEKIELTESQKPQVNKIVADLKTKVDEIRANNADNDRRVGREKVREALDAARRDLGKILTNEQREELREAMRPPGPPPQMGDQPAPPRPPRDGDRAGGNNPPGENKGPDGNNRDRAPDRDGNMHDNPPPPPPDAPPPPPRSETSENKPTANAVGRSVLSPGDIAPPLAVTDLSGRAVTLESLPQTRTTILIFGSLSSPAFRDRAAAINQLREDLGTRGNVLVVYTREAHPAGQWDVERNRADKISVPAHESIEARISAARKAAKSLKLDTPMVVDSFDDATLNAYGNNPAGAVVIREGKVAGYQKNFEPHGIERVLE